MVEKFACSSERKLALPTIYEVNIVAWIVSSVCSGLNILWSRDVFGFHVDRCFENLLDGVVSDRS